MRLTLNAASINSVSLGVAFATSAFASNLFAQTELPGDNSEPTSATHGSEATAALPRVQVTAVGALPAAALEQALGPALRTSYRLGFSSANRFGPEDLFRARTRSPTSVHIWVDTRRPGTARLYFANRDGTRYLMRTLELSDSLTEMDREALAQTIEWSLQALIEGTAGITRAEAEALLSEGPVTERAVPRTDDEPRRSPDAWRSPKVGWFPEVALLQRFSLHSAELPVTQGPVLRFGMDRLLPRHQFGFALSAQYQYPERYAELGVAIELESVASRLEARYLATGLVAGSALGVSLGLGVDAVSSRSEALDQARFEATENGLTTVPLVTAGLLWQLRVEPQVRLELCAGVELDLVSVHYDVVARDGKSTLLSRWPARPWASFGLALF